MSYNICVLGYFLTRVLPDRKSFQNFFNDLIVIMVISLSYLHVTDNMFGKKKHKASNVSEKKFGKDFQACFNGFHS